LINKYNVLSKQIGEASIVGIDYASKIDKVFSLIFARQTQKTACFRHLRRVKYSTII